MDCLDFDDRLYDEDVRRSMAEDARVPEDLARHLERCSDCRQAYLRARADKIRLGRVLFTPAPQRLIEAVLRDMEVAVMPRPAVWDWKAALSWAGTAGALMAALLERLPGRPVSPMWAFVICVLGMSFALTLPILGEALEGALGNEGRRR